MTLIQILLILFLLFALSRVYLRYKSMEISSSSLIFWGGVFTFAIIIVSLPSLTTRLAQVLRIGRGVDVVVYASIVLLFYLIFRLYIYLQEIRNDITDLVREISLKNKKEKNGKSSTQD